MKNELTDFGFKYGDAEVQRICSDEKKGWVLIAVKTSRKNQELQIYVTKTGKVRVYRYWKNKEMKESL